MSRSMSVSRSMRASFCAERATDVGGAITIAVPDPGPENKRASGPFWSLAWMVPPDASPRPLLLVAGKALIDPRPGGVKKGPDARRQRSRERDQMGRAGLEHGGDGDAGRQRQLAHGARRQGRDQRESAV